MGLTRLTQVVPPRAVNEASLALTLSEHVEAATDANSKQPSAFHGHGFSIAAGHNGPPQNAVSVTVPAASVGLSR